uniref:Putative secreted protein n=1 Tax=Anopheles darlingi TaxID=43151 RepID=A0A2M4DN43_ANODA
MGSRATTADSMMLLLLLMTSSTTSMMLGSIRERSLGAATATASSAGCITPRRRGTRTNASSIVPWQRRKCCWFEIELNTVGGGGGVRRVGAVAVAAGVVGIAGGSSSRHCASVSDCATVVG